MTSAGTPHLAQLPGDNAPLVLRPEVLNLALNLQRLANHGEVELAAEGLLSRCIQIDGASARVDDDPRISGVVSLREVVGTGQRRTMGSENAPTWKTSVGGQFFFI